MKITAQQQVLAIAAGIVGARYDLKANRIVAEEGKSGTFGWDAEGNFFMDLSAVQQNEKWKAYYQSKMLATYDAATKTVQAVIASKGKAL